MHEASTERPYVALIDIFKKRVDKSEKHRHIALAILWLCHKL